MLNLALVLQRKNQYAEATDYWRRYLAIYCQTKWATRACRSLNFCKMQVHSVAYERTAPIFMELARRPMRFVSNYHFALLKR